MKNFIFSCRGVLLLFALLPVLELFLPVNYGFAERLQPIFIFAVLGLGLNVITGYTGMLHLGVSGLMATGAFSFAIMTCDIFPFQFGFFGGIFAATWVGALVGVLIGIPTMRLSGDYLAIVTLGLGEIIQSLIRNLDTITRGTQGINPLPGPVLFGYSFTSVFYLPWYYLLLFILGLLVLLSRNLELSRIGRTWMAIREDELASRCMGIKSARSKLLALVIGSAFCALAGGLWASYLGTSGEPGNYDFQISIIALCIVIIGGMGSISGVLIGALLIVGFNSVVLAKIADLLTSSGVISGSSVFSQPSNWKYMIFGIALVLMMRLKPEGLLPSRQVK